MEARNDGATLSRPIPKAERVAVAKKKAASRMKKRRRKQNAPRSRRHQKETH